MNWWKKKKNEKKKKLAVGDRVVFRLWEFGMVGIGEYLGTNDYPDWEIGCPVVRSSRDGRKYAIESHRGGSVRLANEQDIAHFTANGKARESRSLFPEVLDVNVPEGTAKPSKAKKAEPITGIGSAAAAAVEKKLEDSDES